MVALAPDLAASPALRRIEGNPALGERFAAQLSVAYKGAWIRTTRCFARGSGAPPGWDEAERWFAEFAPRLDLRNPPESPADWRLEACVGAVPLSTVAARGRPSTHRLPPGSLAVVSARVTTSSGPWLGACPVLLGGDGKPGRRLTG
jgi:hypothetical protein